MAESISSLFDALLVHLQKELDAHQELLQCVYEEKKVLIRADLTELLRSNARKEILVQDASRLEGERRVLLAAIGRHIGEEAGSINMSRILDLASSKQRDAFVRYRQALSGVATMIASLNRANQRLVEAARQDVNSWLHFLQRLMYPDVNYASSGSMKAASFNGRLLDRRG